MFANAEAYQRFMGRWSTLVAPLFVDFTGIGDGGEVLDVGSGTGALASAIAERHGQSRVIGIDPSKEYVAYASSRSAFANRTTFQVGDAQKLQFADRTFRGSLSLLVFNFIPDARKALSEVCRVTERGGRVSAAVWDYGGRMTMLRAFWDGAVDADANAERVDEKHMPLCRSGELSQLWTRGGLESVQERSLEITTPFETFADYWEPFLLGQGPAGAYVRTVPAERQQRLREAVKRRLSVTDESAAFALPARVWAVRGTVPMA